MAKEVLELEVKSNISGISKDTEAIIAAIKGAKEETKGLSKETENVGDASKKSVGGIKKLTVGFKTLAKATGFIFLMNKAFEVFQEILGKNQKVVDAFDIAMESLSIAFNDLFGFIENNVGAITGFFKDIFENPAERVKELGTAIKEGLIDRFNQAVEVMGLVAKSFGQLISGEFSAAFDTIKEAGKETVDVFTGVDKSYDDVAKSISNYVTETVKSAKATVQLNKDAEIAKVQVQGLIEEYDRQAEKLRQVRDDETKTFAERIEANKQLGDVLIEQGVEMQKLVDIQVKAAQVEFNKNQSQENLIALTEALNEKKAVEAQITGFQSEQLTNQVSLEKELGEVKKEVTNASLEGMELELAELKNSYEMQLEMARKAGEDTTAIEKKYAKDRENIKKGEQLTDEEIAKNKMAMNIDIANQGLQILGDAAGEGTAIAKAAAIAQATIAGTQSVINAFNSANANVGATAGTFGAYPITMAGLAATFSAMNIAKIASGGKPSASGGGGGGAAPQTPAPQMMSGAFELGGGIKPEPMKAFVVTDEMSNSQNQLANIRRTATI